MTWVRAHFQYCLSTDHLYPVFSSNCSMHRFLRLTCHLASPSSGTARVLALHYKKTSQSSPRHTQMACSFHPTGECDVSGGLASVAPRRGWLQLGAGHQVMSFSPSQTARRTDSNVFYVAPLRCPPSLLPAGVITRFHSVYGRESFSLATSRRARAKGRVMRGPSRATVSRSSFYPPIYPSISCC